MQTGSSGKKVRKKERREKEAVNPRQRFEMGKSSIYLACLNAGPTV